MKKHNNSGRKSEPTSKPTKSRGPVQRDAKEVLAELVGNLKEKLDPKKVAATSAGKVLFIMSSEPGVRDLFLSASPESAVIDR